MRISTFFYTIKQGLKNIWKNKMFSLASIATMTACIFLFGLFYTIVTNFQSMVKDAESGVAVTVFFDEGISQDKIDEIGDLIRARAEVSNLEFVSADDAWDSFKQTYFEGNEAAAESFAGDNPLANDASYSIYMNDISMQQTLVTYLQSVDGIREVKQSAVVANTLTDFNKLIGYVSAGIIIILLGVAVFLISNTITVGISVRREEIGIMKLIGATDYFVRAPFVVEGIVIGLIGAAIPLGILYVLYGRIIDYIGEKFSFISNMMKFLPVDEVFHTLVPVALILGVGMKKRNILRRILAVVLVLTMATGLTAQAKGDASSTSLKEAQKEKAALEKQLKAAKELINDLKDSKGDVEDKVQELNNELVDISSKITSLENQLADKSTEIADAEAELAQAEADKQKQYDDMKTRIRYMYENSQTTYLEQLLESNSVAEFLNTAEYIAEIQKYDRQKLDEYTENIEYITVAKEQLEQDYADLENMKANVESQKQSVAALMSQKETELAGITSNISDAQEDAKYFEAEIQAQNELIAEIKRIEAEKAAAAAKAAAEGKEVADNPYTGGAFTWPCPSSTRVTSDYGTRVSPTSGASSNHKGIDIGASAGAAIVAAANGTVKAANYSSAAGNYVMIDHGGGLYTVYMHCSSLAVSEGTAVSAGQTIAYVGSTGISTGNHLHFGVSLNGSYVSPWSYLKG